MKRILFLAPLLLGYASVASTFPAFPAYDPFTDATASGGTSYAVGSTLAGQTNAMGQYWYAIDSNGPAANALKVTATSLSYNSVPGLSGNAVMLTNAAGPGARMFFQTSPPLNIGSAYYYSVVLVASNINTLSSTTGGQIMGFGTQGTIGNQTSQPAQGSALWMKQVGTSPNFSFQFGLTGSGSPGTPTIDTANTYSTSQAYFVVVAIEAGGIPRLWVNPDPGSFGGTSEPSATFSGPAGTLQISAFTCVQMFDIANAANNLYVSAFRMGTNWSWVTGGPAIGQQPLANTNCATGVLNLSVTAMDNGTPNAYRWQFNGTDLTDGPSISGSGATVSGSGTPALTISGMTLADAGAYTVVVTNNYGALTSAVSAVTTFSRPVISVQPAVTNLHLFAGTSATNSLTAVGYPPLAYNWYSNNVFLSAITNSSFPVTNVQDNATFYCIVTNIYGSTTSSVVALTVVPRPASPYPLAVFNDQPMAFWPLNEAPDNTQGNNGTPAFDYAGGNNGYYTNALLAQAGYGAGLAAEYGYSPATDTDPSAGFGQYPSAYQQDSYVGPIPNINFGSSVTPSFSVEAWANGLSIVAYTGESVINKGYGGGGEQFTLDYTSSWRFFVRNSGGTQITALSTNHIDSNWHHLVGVVDAGHSNITLYVDGLARAATTIPPTAGILYSTDPVIIGSRKSTASTDYDDNFYGDIQDVAVYNYALTPAQVANHYYAAGIAPSVAIPSSTNVNEGSTLVVPSSVVGSPTLAYQWYDVTSGNPGTPLIGQTNATLVITNIMAQDYSFHSLALTVTNLYGQVTSASIFLQIVTGPPTSVTITPSSFSAYAGLPVAFTVAAQGAQPFFYHWSTNGVTVPGATGAIYTNLTTVAGSYTIGCQVSNKYDVAPLVTANLTVVALPADAYGATVLRAGPVAFWRLDEPANATTAYDYVGGHNATYNNAINGQPGFSSIIPSETSTEFGDNGVTPSMAEENSSDVNGVPQIDFSTQGANAAFTMEAWINEPLQSKSFLCKGYPNNTQFALDTGGSGGAFRFVVHNAAGTLSSATATGFLPDGNWHHVVGVCDQASGSIRLYVDGKSQGTGSVAPGTGLLALPSSYPVIIASQETQGGASFSGPTNAFMGQVAIYGYALSASQVASNYNAATHVPAPTISAVLSGTNLVLTYTGTLLSSTNVNQPVTNVVPGATSPYMIPATNSQRFFRSGNIP